jgi:hypothetical protein
MGLNDRPLAREITVVLVLKVLAIAVIWGVFFNPGTRPDTRPPAIGAHLLPGPSPTLPAPTAPDSAR